MVQFNFDLIFHNFADIEIRLSEIQRKTGAELVYNDIVGPNLGRHLLFCPQVPPHNAVRDEISTSFFMNFGRAK